MHFQFFLWLAIILTSEERKKITTTSAKLLLMFLTRGSVKEQKSFATETIRKETKQKNQFYNPMAPKPIFRRNCICRLCVNFLVFTVSLRNESCGQELRFNYYVCSKISMDTEVVMLGMIVLQKIYPRRLSVLHAYRLIAVL